MERSFSGSWAGLTWVTSFASRASCNSGDMTYMYNSILNNVNLNLQANNHYNTIKTRAIVSPKQLTRNYTQSHKHIWSKQMITTSKQSRTWKPFAELPPLPDCAFTGRSSVKWSPLQRIITSVKLSAGFSQDVFPNSTLGGGSKQEMSGLVSGPEIKQTR